MPKFQVQYINGSSTVTDTFEAVSYVQLVDLFQNLVNGEIIEIRQIIEQNQNYKKDDGDYIKSASCFLTVDTNTIFSFKIPKLIKTLTSDQLKEKILQYVKINSKTPKTIKITTKY